MDIDYFYPFLLEYFYQDLFKCFQIFFSLFISFFNIVDEPIIFFWIKMHKSQVLQFTPHLSDTQSISQRGKNLQGFQSYSFLFFRRDGIQGFHII